MNDHQRQKDLAQLGNQPTYALENLVRALSMFSFLNTREQKELLEAAKRELARRRGE